ncbi:hypothetical protein ACHAWF_015294 [Thalassiosira exigua]
MPAMKTSQRRLATLLLLAPVTLTVAFAPSARRCFAAAQSTSYTPASTASASAAPPSTTTGLCSTNQVDGNMAKSVPQWFQHEISITAPSRGCHLITSDVTKAIQGDMTKIKIGMANLFIQHTSASLTINENADPDVRRDMEVALNKIVPGHWTTDGTFLHTMEGEDDMPGHVKSSLMGPSLNIPIRNGRLALGTWQGIYLNEHRNQGGWGGGHTRRIIITLQGQA